MKKSVSKTDVKGYASNYSPAKLGEKLSKVASRAGVKTVYAALLLYYAVTDDAVPMKDKMVVIGALGYFILPVDLIPDLLGPLGFTDDFGVLVMACKTIWNNINDSIKARAKDRLSEWFGDVADSDLNLF